MIKKTVDKVPDIPNLRINTLEIRLVGDSSLIVHKWSEKAKAEMRAKHAKEPLPKKGKRDPEQEYKDSLYEYPGGGYGFPTIAFKAAAVTACSQVEGITKVLARSVFHIDGELVKIDGEPNMREDMVRVGMGTADLRYRGEFKEWAVSLKVKYNATAITPSQIINLFDIAGFGVGVGEGRPERNMAFGRFHVDR